jgi:hypothetical protein
LLGIERARLSFALAVTSQRRGDEIVLEAGDASADDAPAIDRKALASALFLTIHGLFGIFSCHHQPFDFCWIFRALMSAIPPIYKHPSQLIDRVSTTRRG